MKTTEEREGIREKGIKILWHNHNPAREQLNRIPSHWSIKGPIVNIFGGDQKVDQAPPVTEGWAKDAIHKASGKVEKRSGRSSPAGK